MSQEPASSGPLPPRYQLECPSCGKVLTEYVDTCPACGRALLEEYAATFTPGATPARRFVSVVLLVVMGAFIVAGLGILWHTAS